jgi:BirA family biotin operon repressor/biotin-[acetyl-CoA-carboxylase] ligase
MVNKTISPRYAILSRLRSEDGPVSGARVCDELGMSRVGVWKHIEALKACGYDIVSDHSGYRLASEGDFLYPWEFPAREASVVHFRETDSTMDRALRMALDKPDQAWIVLAESQKKGRGRRGKSWQSEPGGVFCTLVLHPELDARSVLRVMLAGGVALCRAIRQVSGLEAWLEWPNDLYVDGKKIAGLLPEYLMSGEGVSFLNLGIGVNVSNRPRSARGASLESLSGARISRRATLCAFLDLFDGLDGKRGLEGDGVSLAAQWWSLSTSRGRAVSDPWGKTIGRAAGVDPNGDLIVESPSGEASVRPFGTAYIISKEKQP